VQKKFEHCCFSWFQTEPVFMDTKGADNKLIAALGRLGSIGFTMAGCILLGLAIGVMLDNFFGTSPLLTIIFLLFGIAIGLFNMIKKGLPRNS
jgi:F0F1-type ATP synthase assembly protein I